jgi:hypothetical protein
MVSLWAFEIGLLDTLNLFCLTEFRITDYQEGVLMKNSGFKSLIFLILSAAGCASVNNRPANREPASFWPFSSSREICNNLDSCLSQPDSIKRPQSSNSGVVWRLVARKLANGRKYEVWMDDSTKLYWGDRLDRTYSLGCVEQECTRLGRLNGEAIRLDWFAVAIDSEGRVATEIACGTESVEGKRSNPGDSEKKYGVPTMSEFSQAENDGIREVLPNMADNWYWTSTVNSVPKYQDAHVFNGSTGKIDPGNRSVGVQASVRCVGR